MWKTFGSRPLTVSSSTRGGPLATRRDLLSSPFKATPPTSPTAHPSMNFSAAHRQTYLPWNTAVTVTAKGDRKSTRLNSSHLVISYAVFCLKKKKITDILYHSQNTTASDTTH